MQHSDGLLHATDVSTLPPALLIHGNDPEHATRHLLVGITIIRVVGVVIWVWSRGCNTATMGIISVYIINKAGGLIFSHDVPSATREAEVEFSQHPVAGLVLEEVDRNVVVKYGEIRPDPGESNAVLGERERERERERGVTIPLILPQLAILWLLSMERRWLTSVFLMDAVSWRCSTLTRAFPSD